MIISRSTLLRNARAAVHTAYLSGGKAVLYTGPMPTGGEAITTQVKIAEIDIPDQAGSIADGVFALTQGLEAQAIADGQAGFIRLLTSNGEWIMDLDAGPQGSGAAVIVSPAMIYAGGTVRIDRLRLIEP